MKNQKWLLAGGAGVVVVAGILIVAGNSPRERSGGTPKGAVSTPVTIAAPELSNSIMKTNDLVEIQEELLSYQVSEGPDLPPLEEVEPVNFVNGMDPENQPRTYYTLHFHSMDQLPDGFEADGVVLTPRGIELAHSDDEGTRRGTLISAPEEFEFPVNALLPMWLEEVPEGTAVMIEVQVTADGENWGEYQYAPIDTDHATEIEPFYPDGSPNPNYGYYPGGLFAFGDLQYTQMRYRITLISDTVETPSIAAYRTFYMDTTMGEGRLASVDELPRNMLRLEPEPEIPESRIVYNPVHDPGQHVEWHQHEPGTVVVLEHDPNPELYN